MGLDISSTTVGLCILSYSDSSITLDHVEYIKPLKTGNIFERLTKLRNDIQERIDKFNPDEFAIEDIILFMKGKSTAKTITTLAIFNRTVGLSIFDKTNKLPILYNTLKIRHAIKQDGIFPSKQDIPELVAKLLDIKFPYANIAKGKNKGKPRVENEDMADSIAVALCHIFLGRKPKKEKKKKK